MSNKAKNILLLGTSASLSHSSLILLHCCWSFRHYIHWSFVSVGNVQFSLLHLQSLEDEDWRDFAIVFFSDYDPPLYCSTSIFRMVLKIHFQNKSIRESRSLLLFIIFNFDIGTPPAHFAFRFDSQHFVLTNDVKVARSGSLILTCDSDSASKSPQSLFV